MAVELKRRLARAVAVITIALGAGHLVQNMPNKAPKQQSASSKLAEKPTHIETLAAKSDPAMPVANKNSPTPQSSEPKVIAAEAVSPKVQPEVASPVASVADAKPIVLADASTMPPAAKVLPAAPLPSEAAKSVQTLPQTPAQDPSAVLPIAKSTPTTPSTAPAAIAADPCLVTLDLYKDVNAMIGVTLVSPCHKSERVVLKHAGLAITARTTETGVLFTDMPALEESATIEVLFKDGDSVTGSLKVPEVAKLRRFAVQWQADDAFQIHAFEDDTGYGGPGDVTRATPHRPAAGLPTDGGFLTILGDDTTELPLMAELYTFPADIKVSPAVVVEAAVTAKACGRELLGETLTSMAGKVSVADLSVSMPECSAVGDYLVLKNLVPEMNIASSD